jgi:hypothetical protein
VRVQASPVHDRLAKLVVDDDGIGLPSGLHPAQAGTLGLRLVGDLARQMQGTIAIERDPGTTFTIHFPLEP